MSVDKKQRIGILSMLMAVLIAWPGSSVLAQKGDMPLTASKEAIALFKQGLTKAENLEDAGTLFDQAVQKDPNFAFGYLFAGQNNREFRKNLETAVKLADKASPGEREWIMAVWDANNANDAGNLAHLQQLLKLHPRDKRAHVQMAGYYGGTDDATALKHLNEAVKIDKKYAPAYNSIGYTYMALGKYPEAESAFKTYISLIPNNPNPYDSYAEMLMRTGKYDESIKQYNMALAKDPTFVASYRGIGNNYAYKGDYPKSRQTYGLMYEKAPNNAVRQQALAAAANAWLAEGKMPEALEVNAQRLALARSDNDVQTIMALHNLAGFICVESGDLECAVSNYEMAGKLVDDATLPSGLIENRRFNADLNQIRVLAARGDFDAARTKLDAMRQFANRHQDPNTQFGYNYAAGYIAYKQKDHAEATKYFAKANPQDPFVWYYQALAYDGAGDTATAAATYRKVAEWHQLDGTGYVIVRRLALGKLKK